MAASVVESGPLRGKRKRKGAGVERIKDEDDLSASVDRRAARLLRRRRCRRRPYSKQQSADADGWGWSASVVASGPSKEEKGRVEHKKGGGRDEEERGGDDDCITARRS